MKALNLNHAPHTLKTVVLEQLQSGQITTGQAVKILRRAIDRAEARLRRELRPHHSSGFHNETTGVSPSLTTPYFG